MASNKLGQQRDGPKLATAVSGKSRSSKTHEGTLPKASKATKKGSAGATAVPKPAAECEEEEEEKMAEPTSNVPFLPKSRSLLETKSFSKNTSSVGSPQQQVHFSHVIYRTPPVATACTRAATDSGTYSPSESGLWVVQPSRNLHGLVVSSGSRAVTSVALTTAAHEFDSRTVCVFRSSSLFHPTRLCRVLSANVSSTMPLSALPGLDLVHI